MDEFTPQEIKDLIAAGELKFADMKLLSPKEQKMAMEIFVTQKIGDVKGDKLNMMPMPPMGPIGGPKGPLPKNVEKIDKYDDFQQIGRGSQPGTSGNVTKQSPQEAIKGGDRITQILFGGANAVKNTYPPAKKPPMGPQDILQMIQNMKEISKAGLSGVTRRRPK